jgi:hypothetical protein
VAEEDDAAYRREINEVLRRHGFAWVAEQAEAQIAEGKPSSKQVSEREVPRAAADPMFRVGLPKRRRASLITSEPYSESERLDILLQAIESAVIQRADIEAAVLNQLSEITSIEFQPEAPAGEPGGGLGTAHRLDRSRIEPGTELRRRTEHALAAMRGRDRASP